MMHLRRGRSKITNQITRLDWITMWIMESAGGGGGRDSQSMTTSKSLMHSNDHIKELNAFQ